MRKKISDKNIIKGRWYNINPDLHAPATPEKILMSINQLKKKKL